MLSDKERGADWGLQTSKLFDQGNWQKAQSIQDCRLELRKGSWGMSNQK